ncbi:nitroreductase family protein [Mailhella massiliensis]|uniref:Nitroreductase family protein n=1 Tax=Mailhella massiliensis TaxID=1903261 RepID=A0A921DQL2_9BACT|nr:nitroreductase family protein [Mailhella massiliensis]HJD96589.1 nitroreductase family protein [Mailhella massiliensis]
MDITQAIATRRSIRSYTNEPVTKEELERLVSLAVKAPTGSGMEPWGFVALQDRREIDELSERIKKKVLDNLEDYPQFSQYETWLRSDKYHIFNHAGTVLIIYGDTNSHWHVYDCSLVAGNIMLAGQDEGIGCCWIGFAEALFDDAAFKAAHQVPEHFHLVATLSMGHTKVPVPPCTRKPPVFFSWN